MRFSVIIPVYNKEPYVEKAIRSVLTQTFTDYELIVVNDGSKDGSLAVVESVLSDVPSAVVINQSNAGVSTARNNGVTASKGDYICFLDADDWWQPTFLEDMSQLITDFPEAGIYGTGYIIINERKHKTGVANIGVEQSFEKGYINYCRVYAKTLCMPLTSITVAIPRSVFMEMDGFKSNLKLGEDFDLWIRIALKYKVAYLNEPLSNYNQDVDAKNRGIGHLHNPESHMLWNLDYLEPLEKTDADYKQLIDNLRTYGLLPYYISRKYHTQAKAQLDKVDWSRQPKHWDRLYSMPVWYLRTRQCFMRAASKVKTFIKSI